MELRHLRYFVAVAEELHFRRAAERLHMSQPPLSQQIRALEQEVGARLLERSSRRVELTSAGEAFYGRAREILEAVDDAQRLARRVERGEVGRLSVGFVGSAMYSVVPELLSAFRERSAGVDLQLRELTTTAQLRALERGQIDIGFIRPAGERDGIAVETVLREPVVVAVPDGHPLAARQRVRLEQLAGEPLVLLTRSGAPGLRESLARAIAGFGGEAGIVQEAEEMQTVVGLVAAGVGVSLVPESVRALVRRGVTYRALEDGDVVVELAVAWRRDDRTPVLAAFLELIRGLGGVAPTPAGGER